MAIRKDRIENGGLILFLGLITASLALIVSSFASALLWAALAALLFQPLFQRLLHRWPGHRNIAVAVTLLIITFAVVVPAFILASLIVDQAAGVYQQMRNGEINFATYFRTVHDALPWRIQGMLDSSGLDTFERVQRRVTETVSNSVNMIAGQALAIGRNAASFVLAFGVGLYVTYFLLRDGEHIGPALVRALPFERSVALQFNERFVSVVRATVKGSGIVALVQGALGGVTFWIVGLPAAVLWGAIMAIAALLPAIGPAIVWVPVAGYLLAIGAVWQAIVVILSGVLLIGLADNVLRPILVGRDTGIPDWLVLVTTLGGIDIFGLSGIVLGPVIAALFLVGWQILTDQREAGADGAGNPGPGAVK